VIFDLKQKMLGMKRKLKGKGKDCRDSRIYEQIYTNKPHKKEHWGTAENARYQNYWKGEKRGKTRPATGLRPWAPRRKSQKRVPRDNVEMNKDERNIKKSAIFSRCQPDKEKRSETSPREADWKKIKEECRQKLKIPPQGTDS